MCVYIWYPGFTISQEGYTAVHFATENSHADVCRILFTAGADKNKLNKVCAVTIIVFYL